MATGELDPGPPARSDGRSSEAAADLRHSGCRLACSCRRPPSFTAQIPRRWPDRYLRSFYAFYTGIIFSFESCFGGKWWKIPGFPCRFLSFLRFKVLTPAAGSDILLLQTIAWFPRNWTSGSQRGLTGGLRKQQLICAIRVAGWPARAGGLLLLQRRYPGDGRTGICVLFMHFIQELYSILSLVLAGNGEKSPDSPADFFHFSVSRLFLC